MARQDLSDSRAEYSRKRLTELSDRLAALREVREIPELTIFAAGSYGRLEASKHSDIDLFFLVRGPREKIKEPRTTELKMFGEVIKVAQTMKFPKFSNDCEYLVLLHTDDILRNLGGRIDDHGNYFTARMLFLLESRCLFGQKTFDETLTEVIRSYFRDFPGHRENFQPIFLMNDICRYWKTMLLNYEHKRNLAGDHRNEAKDTKQRVRNFKLKFSRMTTCFASVAAVGSCRAPVTEKQVIEVAKLTPQQRIKSVINRIPNARNKVDEVLRSYRWFLEMTGLPTEALERHFSDEGKRKAMFRQANEYGDLMFELLQIIDKSDKRLRVLRTLTI